MVENNKVVDIAKFCTDVMVYTDELNEYIEHLLHEVNNNKEDIQLKIKALAMIEAIGLIRNNLVEIIDKNNMTNSKGN